MYIKALISTLLNGRKGLPKGQLWQRGDRVSAQDKHRVDEWENRELPINSGNHHKNVKLGHHLLLKVCRCRLYSCH